MSAPQTTETTPRNRVASGLDRFFSITQRGSSIPREVRGGLVSFVTMAYIVILNPLILGGFSADQAAKDVTGGWLENAQVAAATGLVAGLMTIAMGVIANLPFGIAAGLGINSFLAVSVVHQVTWAEAMGLVVINGVIIVILALTGIRTMIFTAVPAQLKAAITVGIGLFIAFIGLVDSGFVRSSGLASPPLQLGEDGSVGALPTIVFLIGLVIIGTLMARKVKGALLIGIIATTVIAIILQAIFHVPTSVDSKTGWNLNAPGLPSALFALPDLSLVGHFDFGAFSRIGPLAASMLVFTLVFTNFFDAMGTMTGLAKAAGVAKPDGTFPRLRSALVVEGAGAIAGGGASVSSNTVFIDSAAGIGEGARTGMASVITGLLFLASMFLTPLTQVVPLEVAAAGLVVVGALMVAQVKDIEWSDFGSALPAFLTIVVMPLTYSIANGIGAGFISWVLIKALSGKGREVSWLLYVVAAGFLLYFARGPLESVLGVG
ncbi:AGZA family xanthine/uracil permease-like MFS transporter [Curtobacterium sp. PhB130]|uniref:NCS2 family permease n=1 Tax=unclassified Curtobacterium TaxID=257496 RepID=UPI000F4B7701|nr:MULTISPECIES: NCS2 family permease [unclassified Curtobacterium]ROP63344.1 AGZA family xanthine/uracil permease-like MFS transporter [Curtobacterium sp. ZW137]ROS77609.1 AGZA family xanthine/uracil permease-like MFS transporter [Curtobacterium sp. PhB130]TCK66184.1 AGZA family xanthine/uracil permease-like MFS transporter [Curtobacterium sp. PhB136]